MRKLELLVRFVGVAACWIFIPGQILVSIFHIFGRQLFKFSGTPLQELEWHFFVALIFLTFGLAYLSDRHVRIDVLREKSSAPTRSAIEIAGFFLSPLPFCMVTIYFGADYAWQAFEIGERSRAALGLPSRWIIKSVVPLGAFFLLMACIVVTAGQIRTLQRSSLINQKVNKRQRS